MENIALSARGMPVVQVPASYNFPRISETGFIVSIFVFLGIAIVGSSGRIAARAWQRHSFSVDDGFLLLSMISLSACCACMYEIRDSLFLQIYASLGVVPFPKDITLLLQYHRILQAASVLQWVTLFSAKLSLLWFFRTLVRRIAKLELWWMTVVCIVAALGCATIPLGFMVCTDFSASFLQTCSPAAIGGREAIYTKTSVAFDILSDVLVLSVPLSVLWKVQIELRRKVGLACILCLSVFMIVIAIVRVAAARVGPSGSVSDTIWLFFWQTLEAAVAVIMVAITGIPSLISQRTSSTGPTNYKGRSASQKYGSGRNLGRSALFSGNKARSSTGEPEDSIGLKPAGSYTNLEADERALGRNILVTKEYTVVHNSQ